MTRRTHARLAGFTFLFSIAAGITAIAQHAMELGLVVVLGLLHSLSALVLAVTLDALARERVPDLALPSWNPPQIGYVCRL